jgi:filamentous hemagglutinin family protein
MNNLSRIRIAVIAAIASSACTAAELPSLQSKPDAVTISQGDRSMTILSSKKNNVMKWDSFSVSEDANVFFDANNYLNLVTGGKPSMIEGQVYGYGNLYIVNPAGITAGVNSLIGATKLGLSTAPIGDDAIEAFSTNGVLQASAADGIGRVNLLGTINANNLSVDGGQIVIRDVSNITDLAGSKLNNRNSEAIKLTSSMHRIDIGGPASTDIEGDYGLASGEYSSHLGQTPISTKAEFMNINSEGDYFITNDIDLGTITSPLAGGNEFKGNIDGTFSKLSFSLEDPRTAQDVRSGLFAETANASFRNLRIEGNVSSAGDAGSAAGIIAGAMRGGALDSVEIRNSSVSFTRDAANRSAGGVAGIISDSVSLKNSSVVLDGAFRDYASDGLTDAGLIAGRLTGSINGTGLSFAALSDGGSMDAVGLNSGKVTFPASMDEAWSALDSSAAANFAEEDGVWTDWRFHDVFDVKNFTLDEDAGTPDYEGMIASEAFEPSSWFKISLERTPDENGAYEFSLSDKRTGARSLLFRNTDASGTQSLSASGLALVSVPHETIEPEEPDITVPDDGGTIDSGTGDNAGSGDTGTGDTGTGGTGDTGTGDTGTGGTGVEEPSDSGNSDEGNASSAGDSDAGSGKTDADEASKNEGSGAKDSNGSAGTGSKEADSKDKAGGSAAAAEIDLESIGMEKCAGDKLCRVITAKVKFSEYGFQPDERLGTMRLRIPALPDYMIAEAQDLTRRFMAGLFAPSVDPDPISGQKQKAAV